MLNTALRLDFYEPTVEDAAWAAPLLSQSGSMACEYSFTTIYIWRRYYNNQIARLGDSFFIRSGTVDPLYLLPVGGDLRENIELLRAQARDKGEQLQLFGADEAMRAQIEGWYPGVFDWQASPQDFDYLYNTEDLAQLSGRKYHSKRNHIASFNAKYAWSYEKITEDNRDEVMQMVSEWCREKGNCSDPSLQSERCGVWEAMQHMKELSLMGGLLRVEGKVVAMTIASPISSEVVDIHVEKALQDYSGAYAMINREFAARELEGRFRYINRENDLGIEGLRRAKKSYNPVRILEKYLATEMP